jgi:hypothetical protein
MSQQRTAYPASGPWLRAAFWDAVEAEVEAIDWSDFAEFVAADRLPIQERPEFERELRRSLLSFVRSRYST